jgi:hypothetical protein
MGGPWFFLPSQQVLVFRRDDIFQGVPGLRYPCIGTTLSRGVLTIVSPTESLQRL